VNCTKRKREREDYMAVQLYRKRKREREDYMAVQLYRKREKEENSKGESAFKTGLGHR
jgi:hypothetical protein